MAEKDTSQDKTEEPTAKKLKKAREEGNVSLSKEVSSIALLFASLAGCVQTVADNFLHGQYEVCHSDKGTC